MHQKTFQTVQTYRSETEPFWDQFDNPSTKREQLKATNPSTKREQLRATKDYILHSLNNSPNEELTSSTPLPPIDSHKTNCVLRQSPGGARRTPERRRQMSPAMQQAMQQSTPRNDHVTRNRKSSNKPRNKSLKPVVKYQHQKLEPSAEERYRKYRPVMMDGVKKITSRSTPDVWLRSDSGLSSVSDVSALRRRYVQFQSDDEENNNQRTPMRKLASVDWGIIDSDQLPEGLEGLRGGIADGKTTTALRDTEKGNPNEDNLGDVGIILEDSNRCHPTPVADGRPGKDESSIRLPDIQIYNSNQPVLLPETRRFNPDIGETSRAFVFSYFDHLPALSRPCSEDLLDSETQSKSMNVLHTKTLMRRK